MSVVGDRIGSVVDVVASAVSASLSSSLFLFSSSVYIMYSGDCVTTAHLHPFSSTSLDVDGDAGDRDSFSCVVVSDLGGVKLPVYVRILVFGGGVRCRLFGDVGGGDGDNVGDV